MAHHLTEALEEINRNWNTQKGDAVVKQCAEDVVYQDPFLPQAIKGREAVAQYLNGLFTAFPDFTIVNRGKVVEGDEAVLRNDVVRATMKGPIRTPQGQTIPPTHKSFSGEYAVVLSFDSHQKVKNFHIFGDSLGIFRQLGLPPP
jgi:steroid delta-isomerase-like uncharacterized protein